MFNWPAASRWLPWLLPLAAVLVYANSLSNPFVFDDRSSILANESVRQLWPDASPGYGRATDGRPLVRLSFALNYELGGYDVRFYRAVNIAIHILCAWLLFVLLRQTLLKLGYKEAGGAALATALLWLVHPLNSECINYISQRSELLMALFYLAVLSLAQRAAQPGASPKWNYAAIAACAAGMLCKESMVTAPVVVALYDRAFLWPSWRAVWMARRGLYAGLAATWVVLAVLVAQQPRGYSAGWGLGLGVLDYALNQSTVVCTYIQRVFWPQPLLLDYGFAQPMDVGQVWPQLLLLLLALALSLWGYRRRSPLGFAALAFFVLLAPSSSIVPILTEVGAERRMYLPLLPLLALCVLPLHTLLLRRGQGRLGVALLLIAVVTLGGITVQRNGEYRSALSIWQATIEVAPDNARAHNNYAEALVAADSLAGALVHFRRAVLLRPSLAVAQHNLATLFKRQGELDSAVVYFRQTLSYAPNGPETHASLCAALLQGQRAAEALPACRRASELKPERTAYLAQWGQALRLLGQLREAEAVLLRALKLDSGQADAAYELAFIYQGQGQLDEAEALYRRALARRADFFAAHFNLAILLEDAGRGEEAAHHYEQARQIDLALWQRVRGDAE